MKRRLLLLFVALALLGLLVVHLLFRRGVREEYEARVAALAAAGQPVTHEDLAPPPVPDDGNAAPLLLAARDVYDAFSREHPEPDLLYPEPRADWPEEAWEDARAYVAAGEDFGRLLEEADERPHCRFDLDWSAGPAMEVPAIPIAQAIAHYLEYRALLEADDPGGSATAARSLLLLLRARDWVGRPWLIGYLVMITVDSVAIRTLREIAAKPGFDAAAVRALLDPRLRELEDEAALRDAFVGERVMAIWCTGQLLEGRDPSTFVGDEPDPAYEMASPLLAPLVYRDGLAFLDLWERALALLELPYPAALAAATTLDEEADARAATYFVTRLFSNLPIKAVRERADHAAWVRTARIALALLAQREEDGAFPESLAELRFDGALPLDPFTQEPFRYARTGAGARLEAAVPIRPEQEAFRDELEIVWDLR